MMLALLGRAAYLQHMKHGADMTRAARAYMTRADRAARACVSCNGRRCRCPCCRQRILAGKCRCAAAEGDAVRCTTQTPCHTRVTPCRPQQLQQPQQPASHFARGHNSLESIIVVIGVVSITLPAVLVVLLLLTVPWCLLLLLPLLPLPSVLLRWVPAPAASPSSPTTAAASASAVVSAVSASAASAVAVSVAPGTREGARAAVAPRRGCCCDPWRCCCRQGAAAAAGHWHGANPCVVAGAAQTGNTVALAQRHSTVRLTLPQPSQPARFSLLMRQRDCCCALLPGPWCWAGAQLIDQSVRV